MTSSVWVVPASIGFVIVVPVLVGQSTNAPSAPAEVKATDASIVVATDNRAGFPYSSSSTLVRVQTLGLPPAKDTSADLVDASGLNVAHVKASDNPAACDNLPIRYTGTGTNTTPWCLDVTDLPSSADVKGKVTGAKVDAGFTALSMEVTSRHTYFPLPFLVTGLGLVIGVAIALLPTSLKSRIRAARLDAVVGENAEAGAGLAIGRLEHWVDVRRKKGADDSATLKQVLALVETAPGAAKQARATLRSKAETLPTAALLRADALAQADQRTLDIGDFLDDDGKDVAHPAAKLVSLVQAFIDAKAHINQMENDLDRLKNKRKQELTPIVRAATAALERMTDDATLDALNDAMNEARHELDVALGEPDSLVEEHAGMASLLPFRLVNNDAAAAPREPTITNAAMWTAGFAVAIGLIAFVTIYMSGYAPKAAFGSGLDYTALLIASIASGAGATLATLFTYWTKAD